MIYYIYTSRYFCIQRTIRVQCSIKAFKKTYGYNDVKNATTTDMRTTIKNFNRYQVNHKMSTYSYNNRFACIHTYFIYFRIDLHSTEK